MVPHTAAGVASISTPLDLVRHKLSIAGTKSGFVSHGTTSDHGFGSLQHYSDEWNLADYDDLTSKPSHIIPTPDPRLHAAAPGMVLHKLQVAQQAFTEAKVSALVSLLRHHTYIILVPEVRVE